MSATPVLEEGGDLCTIQEKKRGLLVLWLLLLSAAFVEVSVHNQLTPRQSVMGQGQDFKAAATTKRNKQLSSPG